MNEMLEFICFLFRLLIDCGRYGRGEKRHSTSRDSEWAISLRMKRSRNWHHISSSYLIEQIFDGNKK